ncbi:MAG: hypothetical protein QFB86_03730 [Patescibacteria group bacterium]|nr:hypothetical protein [Patescibacteria group bacterium]
MNLLPKFSPRNDDQRLVDLERSMLRREAAIGGKLFGPLPKGRTRQFFCFDESTWIWHETWKDAKGRGQAITTKYEVRPNGIIKSQDGQPYREISHDEALNLRRAVLLYQQRVDADYQQMLRAA